MATRDRPVSHHRWWCRGRYDHETGLGRPCGDVLVERHHRIDVLCRLL